LTATGDAEEVVIIGAAQAGLATGYELSRLGVKHVVLERGRVAQTWRGRWDRFCLVLPNWTLQLPGHEYDGAYQKPHRPPAADTLPTGLHVIDG
jgi:putative flavoprotein involved in K+ transport